MKDLKYPKWQQPYQAALVELDQEQMLARVHAAETAIFLRLQEMAANPGGNSEKQAIEEALCTLRVLKVEKLEFRDWKI